MISVVVTSESSQDSRTSEEGLIHLSKHMSQRNAQVEVILVVIDARHVTREFCERLVADDPNVKIVVSERPLNASLGTVMGLANAIGERVVLTSISHICHEEIDAGLGILTDDNVDLVRFIPSMARPKPWWHVGRRLARLIFRLVNGTQMLASLPSTQILNRDTARLMGRAYDAESRLFRASPAPHMAVIDRASLRPENCPPFAPSRIGARNIARLVATSEAGMVRLVTGVGLFGAVFALVAGGLAAWSYLFRDDVMPGWTSLAFGIAAIALFQAAFAFVVAEYIVAVYRGLPSSNRIQAVRTYRAARSVESARNVLVVERDAIELREGGTS